MTFCELREKDVINIHDCKRLGCVSDLVFDPKTAVSWRYLPPPAKSSGASWGKKMSVRFPGVRSGKSGRTLYWLI